MQDKFDMMFEQQCEFMKLLQRERGFPEWPIDLSSKDGQRLCKDIVHDSIGEYYEALWELKNTKKHRKTEITGVDREKFLTELSDVAHFFVELLIIVGVTPKEFFDTYMAKGELNKRRIETGY